MEITRKAEYAITALIDLALLPAGEFTLSKNIAERQGIPPNFLPQIMAALSRRGWVEALRGAGGGVRLAVSPMEITVQAVIEIMEGPIALNRCLANDGICPQQHTCPQYVVWSQAQDALLGVLGRTTIKDLADRCEPITVGTRERLRR